MMSEPNQIMLFVFGCLIFLIILASTLYRVRNRKLAILAKPSDGDIYKVFEINIDGAVYNVIKQYIYIQSDCSHRWILFDNYSYYKEQTKEEVIELCNRLNEKHKKELFEKEMTNKLEDITGNIIN